MTVTTTECERDPLVPVTATLKTATVVPVQLRVEVPEPATLVGARVHVRPDGDMLEVSATVPLNPLTAVTVIVDVPEPATMKPKLAGLAVSVKSRTVTVTLVLWIRDPLVPVTVTVYVPLEPEQESVDV